MKDSMLETINRWSGSGLFFFGPWRQAVDTTGKWGAIMRMEATMSNGPMDGLVRSIRWDIQATHSSYVPSVEQCGYWIGDMVNPVRVLKLLIGRRGIYDVALPVEPIGLDECIELALKERLG